MASPADIAIQASNGASDYGNKFGEPLLTGFARSFGLTLPGGERREWIKPIMFSGGIGSLDGIHVNKEIPEKGLSLLNKKYQLPITVIPTVIRTPLLPDSSVLIRKVSFGEREHCIQS